MGCRWLPGTQRLWQSQVGDDPTSEATLNSLELFHPPVSTPGEAPLGPGGWLRLLGCVSQEDSSDTECQCVSRESAHIWGHIPGEGAPWAPTQEHGSRRAVCSQLDAVLTLPLRSCPAGSNRRRGAGALDSARGRCLSGTRVLHLRPNRARAALPETATRGL